MDRRRVVGRLSTLLIIILISGLFILNILFYFRWIFEKYDGIRGFWNPLKKAFFSRRGRKFNMPDEVIASMPNIFLDGELW